MTLPNGRRVSIAPAAGAIQTSDTPNVQIFTFQIGTGATSRSTTSTRRIVGPAILLSASWNLGGAASGAQALEFGVAPSPVQESNVALNGPRQWRPLMTPFTAPVTGDIAGRQGDTQADFVSSSPVSPQMLRVVIMDKDFFFTVTNWNSGAGTDVFTGHVVIAENVSAETLAGFV